MALNFARIIGGAVLAFITSTFQWQQTRSAAAAWGDILDASDIDDVPESLSALLLDAWDIENDLVSISMLPWIHLVATMSIMAMLTRTMMPE